MHWGKIVRIAALMALLAPAGFLALGRAAGGEPIVSPIDCAKTEFVFADPSYSLTCQLVEDDVALASSGAGGKGDIRNEILVAISSRDRVYLSAVSMRLVATRFGFTRSELREVIDEGFSQLEKTDWRSLKENGQYEMAEFRANDRECAAWQRYANPSFGVYKRHVFGFGCSAGGIAQVYAALGKLQAPGD